MKYQQPSFYHFNEDSLELTFINKEDGTQTKIAIPKLEGKTINTVYSPQAIEFQMRDAVASYNNNGTTEHVMSVDNKETIAISYIAGAKVEFREDDGVQTSVGFESQDGKKSELLVVATKEGYSQNSVKNSNGVLSKADSTIIGTQTVIDENGTITVDTPVVVSSLENNITSTSKLDADGNLIVTALKVSKDDIQTAKDTRARASEKEEQRLIDEMVNTKGFTEEEAIAEVKREKEVEELMPKYVKSILVEYKEKGVEPVAHKVVEGVARDLAEKELGYE